MSDIREKRAKINIVISLGCQVLTLICGLIIPQMMLCSFGSEAYGATASIGQFLAYISLLEGGVGGVARAALYKPLAEKDIHAISAVVAEVKKFFRVVAYIFLVYVLVLACSFHRISDIQCMDWLSTFVLVIVISISTFGQYFIGISYSVLLQAAQKAYITNLVSIGTTVVNTLLVIVLVHLGSGLILVKLVSSCVFFLRPVILWYYTKKHYAFEKAPEKNGNYLTQKWNGLGQHIAYFLHSNTDIAILTCFGDLSQVAVYAVYNMVIASIQNLTISFVAGMEAFFGDMLAKKEYTLLHKRFGYYETLISTVSVVLFSVSAVLIVPFVRLYTAGIHDADYIQPLFGLLLALSALLYCVRMPYHSITIAAGYFKQTQVAAYGEAIINVAFSILLVGRLGLVGVAIGTIAATGFRFIYYVIYLSRHIFHREIKLFVKRLAVNSLECICILAVGTVVVSQFTISNFVIWAICGAIVTGLAGAIVFCGNLVMYRSDFEALLGKYLPSKK